MSSKVETDLSNVVVHEKKNGINTLKDRLLYPGDKDLAKITSRFIIPSILVKRTYLSLLFSKREGLIDYFSVAWFLNLFALALGGKLQISEQKQEILFGSLLTVQKRVMTGDSFVGQVFPSLTKARFYGELHFAGEARSIDKFPDPITATREGFRGLHTLAQACLENDPRLEEIDFFAGVSPIVDERYAKFGFLVVDDNSISSLNRFDKLMLSPLYWLDSRTRRKRGINLPDRESMVALITRDALIENMEIFEKLGGVKTES
jgi:hypothetical protein